MDFGKVLRALRTDAGLGIKRLAPDLGVSYTYLSKLENGEVGPSEQLIHRVSRYFRCDEDRLMLAAGKVPAEILEILRANPDEALDYLRRRFGDAGPSKRSEP